eukprot:scaffold3772_cov390-Prasinococcus_capsulatus_cf.AAC.2
MCVALAAAACAVAAGRSGRARPRRGDRHAPASRLAAHIYLEHTASGATVTTGAAVTRVRPRPTQDRGDSRGPTHWRRCPAAFSGPAVMAEADVSRWIVIHPIYMDSKSTIAEGRRIPISKACERPTLLEVRDSVQSLKFEVVVEAPALARNPRQGDGTELRVYRPLTDARSGPAQDKSYSRNFLLRGRLRVKLRNEDGTPVNPEIATRRSLMYEIAKLVPKHQGRKNGKPTQEQIVVPKIEDDEKKGDAQASSSGQSKKDKKKDKKKKKK